MQQILLDTLGANPALTIDGYGIAESTKNEAGFNPRLSQAEQETIVKQKRAAFFSEQNERAFTTCCDYLRTVNCSKSIRTENSDSYHLKHVVERWAGANGRPVYVPKGVFIAAALAMAEEKGIKIKPIQGTTGAKFNIKSPAFA